LQSPHAECDERGEVTTEDAMLQLIQRYAAVVSSDTIAYQTSAYGERRGDGTWCGCLVFTPVGGGRVVVTAQETTQSTLAALAHWAAHISPVYLEGALHRALALRPEAQLERRLEDLERIEVEVNAQATELERAAQFARSEALAAERERAETERALASARADAATAEAILHDHAAARARAEAKAAHHMSTARTRSGRDR